MNLFLDREHKLEFPKIASPVMLSDDPSAWQREVASEIFKQVPSIGDYSVNVVIDRVNPERGYGSGSAEVQAKSDAPDKEQDSLPKVTIPLLIKDRQLQPIDVFMDGKEVFPLSEKRLREHLFRTATFETSTRKPEDRGMADQLYPPMRSNYGNNMMSAGSGSEGGMGKFAAAKFAGDLQEAFEVDGPEKKTLKDALTKKPEKGDGGNPMNYSRQLMKETGAYKVASFVPLLDAISGTVPDQEVNDFLSAVSSDMAIKVAAARNPAFERALLKIAGFQSFSLDKTASALVNAIKPNIVQLTKLASGDWAVKWANSEAYKPLEAKVGPDQASELAGSDALKGSDPGTTVTLSTAKAQKESLTEGDIEVVDRFGRWKVWNAESNAPMEGWALQVNDLENHPLPLFIFVSPEGGSWSLQGDIAGMASQMGNYQEELAPMLVDQPQGDGAFVALAEDGMTALLPMSIQNSGQGPDGGVSYQGTDVYGEPVSLSVAPGLQAVQMLEQGHYAIPDSLKWLPFQGQSVSLIEHPQDVENTQEAQQAPGAVDVGSTGPGEFSMDGAPVDKLATAERHFIKKAEAEFLLVGMGMNPFKAKEALARAQTGEKVKIAGLNPITPLAAIHTEMTKRASTMLENFPYHLRRNLVKEAAALEDSETADKILSLNFINPENISTFVNYLPQLEKTASKLAELLLASRMGASQIPEGATESAMRNLEEVIEGLKTMDQKTLV
jgi:hypothetical protein